MSLRVDVHPYDPLWPKIFEGIREDLIRILNGVAVEAIEHVGSTSVPGLAAKPVIDVDVVVSRTAVTDAITALERAGYAHLGELGIIDRHAFEAPDTPRRNIYVTVEACLALRNHLAVRDLLRSDAGLRDEYGAHKLALAEKDHVSIDAYVAAKSTVLQRILTEAGFDPEELATIKSSNRPSEQEP